MNGSRKKSLDFEINLLPIISILAVCIGFLLLTTVWVQIGTFNLSQAFGTESAGQKKSPPSLWIHFENNGTVQVTVKEVASLEERLKLSTISGRSSRVNINAVEALAQKIKSKVPDLNTALIMPAPGSSYEDMILVMDRLKKKNINDIGIAPL